MPLYMDFHKIDNVTIEEVKSAHMADVSVQEQYGVRYLQFWVNEEAGTVFCLTEGPDQATCELVHKMAHGNVACALTEVEPGFYKTIMGEKHVLDEHMVLKSDGSVDQGYRFFLLTSIRVNARHSQLDLLTIPPDTKAAVINKLTQSGGREIRWPGDDSIIGVFDDARDVLRCALQVKKSLDAFAITSPIVYKAAVSADQPVTKNGEFFTAALTLAQQLRSAANDNEVLVAPLVTQLCTDDNLLRSAGLKFIDAPGEQFLVRLIGLAGRRLSEEDFSIDSLCREAGVSRPQLYRRLTALTGRAPNDFLRDLRLDTAFTMLRSKEESITQIAYKVGYRSPSYFAKCFAGKFGSTPSELLATAKV